MSTDPAGTDTVGDFEQDFATRHKNGATPVFLKGDSLYLRDIDLLSASRSQQFRIFSIDGGHTPYHLVNDILLIEKVLCHGGVVIVDDYTNPGWPGVAEGVARYFLLHARRRLAPFLIHWNKLVLTTESYHSQYYAYVCSICERNGMQTYPQKLYGFDVMHSQGFATALFE
jgi:hypothetical protein